MILTCDRYPKEIDGLEDRLKSRLGCGLVADIHPTTYELRLGILIEKAHKRGVYIPHKVLEFLSHRIISNVREMEGALNRLVAHATLVGTPISVESAQLVLQDLLKSSNKKITIEEIQKKVAEHFNIRITDMHSPRRSRSVARPRQIAMYLAKSITSRSLPEIGRKFGGRDHTTVMHAVKKIEELKLSDFNFNELLLINKTASVASLDDIVLAFKITLTIATTSLTLVNPSPFISAHEASRPEPNIAFTRLSLIHISETTRPY
mgnify:CR=1 FL=1